MSKTMHNAILQETPPPHDFKRFISIDNTKYTGGFELGICGSVTGYLIY